MLRLVVSPRLTRVLLSSSVLHGMFLESEFKLVISVWLAALLLYLYHKSLKDTSNFSFLLLIFQ